MSYQLDKRENSLVFGRCTITSWKSLQDLLGAEERIDSSPLEGVCGPESTLTLRSPSLMVAAPGRNSLSRGYPPALYFLRVQIAVPGRAVCTQPGLAIRELRFWLNTWPWSLNSRVAWFL